MSLVGLRGTCLAGWWCTLEAMAEHGREWKAVLSTGHALCPPREPDLYPTSSRAREGHVPPFQALETLHQTQVPLPLPLMGRGTQIKETDTYLCLESFVSTHDIWFRRRREKTNNCVSSPPTCL